MREGRTWRYLMQQAAEVVEVKCAERRQVGDAEGWLLTGLGGETILAWDGCILRASRLGAMTFDPPIAVLQADKEKAAWNYQGKVTATSVPGRVSVAITQEPVELESQQGGKGLKVTFAISIDGRKIDLVTTFAEGIGIVTQEQRNDGIGVSLVTLMSDRG